MSQTAKLPLDHTDAYQDNNLVMYDSDEREYYQSAEIAMESPVQSTPL